VEHRHRLVHGLHRARITLGESIRGAVQRQIEGLLLEYRTVHHEAGSQAVARAAPIRVQHIHAAFGAPGAYAPGDPPAVESGPTTQQLSKDLDQHRGAHQPAQKALLCSSCWFCISPGLGCPGKRLQTRSVSAQAGASVLSPIVFLFSSERLQTLSAAAPCRCH